jgi:hypothetical protein
MPALNVSLEKWWNGSVRGRTKLQKRQIAALQMYMVWNLWKERNRRIFQGVFMAAPAVLHLIKQELKFRVSALGARAGAFVFLDDELRSFSELCFLFI